MFPDLKTMCTTTKCQSSKIGFHDTSIWRRGIGGDTSLDSYVADYTNCFMREEDFEYCQHAYESTHELLSISQNSMDNLKLINMIFDEFD